MRKETDTDGGQVNLQIEDDGAFRTTLSWLRVDRLGRCTQTKEEKGAVVSRLRVPFRDLRILDPLLPTPYPTAIYIRERALVVNLQSVRVIITAEFAYIISVPSDEHPDGAVAPRPDSAFVKELMQSVSKSTSSFRGESAHAHVDNNLPFELKALEAALTHAITLMETDAVKLNKKIQPILECLSYKVEKGHLNTLRDAKAALNKQLVLVSTLRQELEDLLDDDQDMEDMYLGRRRGEEAMLALQHMANIAQTYTQGTQTDDEDDGSVNGAESTSVAMQTTASETVEQARQPLSQPPGRSHQGQVIQQQPSHIESCGPQHAQHAQPPALNSPNASSQLLPSVSASPQSLSSDLRLPAHALYERASHALQQRHAAEATETDPMQYRADFHEAPALLGKLKRMGGGGRKRSSAYVDPRDIEGCEALLEAHFTQADYTLRRLQQLKERILGTESLVAIELDSRRNELVALNLVVVIITVMFAFVSMVAGIFGQNLHFSSTTTGTGIFLAVTLSSLAAAGLLCFVLLSYARYKRLLLIPSGPEAPQVAS